MTEAFFVPDGDGYVATDFTVGPWSPAAQHAGPPAALLGRELERCEPRPAARIARMTVEILRPVPVARLTVSARIVRPGRSVELLEGRLADERGDVLRATAWRIRTADMEFAPTEGDLARPAPPDQGVPPPAFPGGDEIGYFRAMEIRFVSGSFTGPGPSIGWFRMRVQLVADEEPSPLARVLAAADSGNGISSELDFRRYLFINTDLTVTLIRPPDGEWVCLDARTLVADDGIGMAETAIYDERGRIGRGTQTLLMGAR